MSTARFNTVGSTYNATPVVAVLQKMLHQEILNDTFFSSFRGIQKPGDQDKAPNGIVLTLNELNAGSDTIISTMRMNYTGEAVVGDDQLLGTEEDFAFRYTQTKVGEKGKAFTIPKKGISAQRVKWMNLAREVKPAASDWWKLEEDFEMFKTFYEGCSPHCRNNADVNAQGGEIYSHPNFYAAGSGLVTHASGPHTTDWEEAVGTAVTGVTDTAEDYMGIALLDALAVYLRTTNKIKPLNIGGRAYWVVLLHPNQVAQLQMESTWQTLVQTAANRGKDNPAFQAKRLFPDAIYKQLLIYEHEHIMGITVDTYPSYGTTTLHTALDTSVKKAAIVFGSGAVVEAIPEPIHFETEMRDYKRKWGLGTLTIRGAKRMDWTADDGVQTGVINQSSLVFCTYSAAPSFANPAAS